MNRAELDLITADTEALEALEKAKEAHRSKPTDATARKLDEAKRAVYELRRHWRGIREAVTGGAVPTVRAKTKA